MVCVQARLAIPAPERLRFHPGSYIWILGLHSALLKLVKRVYESFFVFCEKSEEYYGSA